MSFESLTDYMDLCRTTYCSFAVDFPFVVDVSYSLLHSILYNRSTTSRNKWSLGPRSLRTHNALRSGQIRLHDALVRNSLFGYFRSCLFSNCP